MRAAGAGDREVIQWIASSTPHITRDDVGAALARVDAAISGVSEFHAHVLEDDGLPLGFVCFGPVPRTESTWQLYAVGVDSTAHGKGFGRHLLAYAESEARRRGGRLLVIESSSHEEKAGTAAFYERTGYDVVARIPGFYRAGDDRVVFGKVLEAQP